MSVILASMSACSSLPSARSPATTCSWVTPAGICLLTTPSKRMLVALPRILGPIDGNVTLTTASSDDDADAQALRGAAAAEPPQGALEVLGLAVGIMSACPAGPPPGPGGPPRPARPAGPGRAGGRGALSARSCDLLLAQLGGDDLAVGLAGLA